MLAFGAVLMEPRGHLGHTWFRLRFWVWAVVEILELGIIGVVGSAPNEGES